jgi:anti-anti-sigma factor
MADVILYGEDDNNIFIKALGRMTVNCCYELRDRVFTRLDDAPPVGNLYLDLSRCDYMDSTFMGIVLGINKKLKKTTDLGVTVVCPTEECSNLFLGLNILKLFTVRESSVVFPGQMETISTIERPGPEVILRAHDELVEVSEANADKFRVLRGILQKRVTDERKKATNHSLATDDDPEDLTLPEVPEIRLIDE